MFIRKSIGKLISLLALVSFLLADPVAVQESRPERSLAAAPAERMAAQSSTPASSRAAGGTGITLTAAGFEPSALTVTVDTDVVWTNATAQTHILQSGEPVQRYLPLVLRSAAGGAPKTALAAAPALPIRTLGEGFRATLLPGGVFTHTFSTVGEFPYYLADAPRVRGRVVVTYELEAPPLDPTVATTVCDASTFLYTGEDPVQTGVAPGTIDCQRAAVLRGRVLARDGVPLPGAEVTILDHPEYGQTLSRDDGMFDLVVNGGALLTVDYRRDGYLPAQRPIEVPWNDYAWLDDVVLIPVDPQETEVDLEQTSQPFSVAHSSVISDADGTRQETLLIPQGTSAELLLPGGVTQTLTSMNVHLTEYTVGQNGPQAMPAPLPSNVGYTYAFELNADEELAAGAEGVAFSQPLIHYVDNFLDFPAGTTVPLGTYDRDAAVWVPEESGLVLKIVSITGGLADLDIDGDDVPDEPAELVPWGITDDERAEMANLYEAGKSLWRVLVSHFSEPWDANWGTRCKGDICDPPNAPPPDDPPPPPEECQGESSIIGCQTQTLGEAQELAGVPFRLHYDSSRTPGWQVAYTLELPLSGSTVLTELQRIDLEIAVAGRSFRDSFPDEPNLSTVFTWDGNDAYGRPVQGRQKIEARIGFVYEAEYLYTDRFGYSGRGIPISGDRARGEITLWKEWQGLIGAWHTLPEGLGGWNLDVHHTYEPAARLLYQGDGTVRAAANLASIIDIVAGCEVESGECSLGIGDGAPATKAILTWPETALVAPDGSLYLSDTEHHRVRRVGPDGIITTIAGTGSPGFGGDGGPATVAQLYYPKGIALAPDGSLYIADYANGRVRRVGPDGIITTVAGGGVLDLDGVPATQVSLLNVYDVAISADGRLYLSRGPKVRRVDPDGLIWTAAGTTIGDGGDGGPALEAQLHYPHGIALAPDGSLYIADYGNNRVRRVGNDGIITTVAGTGTFHSGGFSGDGGPATLAQFNLPIDVAVAADGSLYIADEGNHRVRYVDPSGIIITVAGRGRPPSGWEDLGYNGPATAAWLPEPSGVDVAPDGTLYVADHFYGFIHQVRSALPGFSATDVAIPSEDGDELYQFTATGRHLRTLNALTGATALEFGYNGAGLLETVTDGDGNVTSIEHDAGGNPLGITGPYGQRTVLSVDDAGCLASVTNPAGEAYEFEYRAGCLLTGLTDPRGNQARYVHDELGRLIEAQDRAGNAKTLVRTETERGYQVALTTALGRTTTYAVERLPTGDIRLTNTFPNGLSNQALYRPDASQVITYTDGTVLEMVHGPDPRWGMLAPVGQVMTTTLPSGLASVVRVSRTAVYTDPANPLSLESLDEVTSLNGRDYTTHYDAASRTFTSTTPAGRAVVTVTDLRGRTVHSQADGLEPSEFWYDALGRLIENTDGVGGAARTTAFSYDASDAPSATTDPEGATPSCEYDSAIRLVQQTLPLDRTIAYDYDPNSNITSLSPPGRPTHTFTYTPVDLVAVYIPPDLGAGSTETRYDYDADRQLTRITRPDGQLVEFDYDAAGHLLALTTPERQTTYDYDPATGHLQTVTTSDGTTLAYGYDGTLPASAQWSGPVTGSLEVTYSADWRLAGLSVFAGAGSAQVAFEYEPDGLVTQAGEVGLTYDAEDGSLASTVLGGVADAWTYNSFGEPTGYSAAYNGAPLFAGQAVRDNLGRVTQKAETVGGVTTTYGYSYDLAGRLVAVTRDGTLVATYTYDSNSNRLTYTGPSGAVTGTYDDQDRLLQYGSRAYTYTANGELLTKTAGGQTTSYQYDPLGNLLAVTLPGGTQVEYVVDGENRRIGKKVNGTLVQGFLYLDDLSPVAELDGAGNLVSLFVYGWRENTPEYLVKGGATYRILADELGSPRLVVNVATGQAAQRLDYDEFGDVRLDTNPGFQPFGFAGGLYDPLTGLIRFGARDYDPVTGRWTAKDPIRFLGGDSNLYGYVLGDPLNNKDPAGLIRRPKCTAYINKRGEIVTNCKWPPRPKPAPRPAKGSSCKDPHQCYLDCKDAHKGNPLGKSGERSDRMACFLMCWFSR